MRRAHDAQRPIREIIDRYLRYITWDEGDDSPVRLTLPQYAAPVVEAVAKEYGLTRDATEATCRIAA